MRRTRISERIKKLQELVPNMDTVFTHLNITFNCSFLGFLVLLHWQQTNTADMLDLSISYIKDLQKQVQVILICNCC